MHSTTSPGLAGSCSKVRTPVMGFGIQRPQKSDTSLPFPQRKATAYVFHKHTYIQGSLEWPWIRRVADETRLAIELSTASQKIDMLVASSRERFEDLEVQIRPGRTCSFHRVFVPVAPSLQDLNLSRNDAKYKKNICSFIFQPPGKPKPCREGLISHPLLPASSPLKHTLTPVSVLLVPDGSTCRPQWNF